MALIATGTITEVKEHEWNSASRGPQRDLLAFLKQDGQDKPTQMIVSYKVEDKVRDLVGKGLVDVVLYIRARKENWHEIIILDAEPSAPPAK